MLLADDMWQQTVPGMFPDGFENSGYDMNRQAGNPFLPENEYIPDGEPYVFGDRVYLYGSHDRFGAPIFCVNDYVCWSAPVDNLGSWRQEGVIYRKNQDPLNRLGLRLLFAPDVVRGLDGRYYLYYAFDFMGIMGVADSDSPRGPFQFYGHVHHADGTVWGRKKGDSFPFDPGVLVDDDGRVYLYSGFYTPVPAIVTGGKRLRFEGGYMLELEPDMVTVRTPEKLLFPKQGPGAFAGHEFFEASSIRKYDGRYYFVYSSRHNHELCYAVSSRPDGGFSFGGTLVSNGDVFLDGIADERHARNFTGNNHGGMLRLNGQYYIFYHRHTARTSYARQACAERLVQTEDGGFAQAEMTSCGLNGGPLKGSGRYGARLACNLWGKNGTGRYDIRHPGREYADAPYVTQDKKDGSPKARQYIANMRDGAVAGFKYFAMDGAGRIAVSLRGTAAGKMLVSEKADFSVINAEIPVQLVHAHAGTFAAQLHIGNGEKALYFRYCGKGAVDFYSFWLGT